MLFVPWICFVPLDHFFLGRFLDPFLYHGSVFLLSLMYLLCLRSEILVLDAYLPLFSVLLLKGGVVASPLPLLPGLHLSVPRLCVTHEHLLFLPFGSPFWVCFPTVPRARPSPVSSHLAVLVPRLCACGNIQRFECPEPVLGSIQHVFLLPESVSLSTQAWCEYPCQCFHH